MRKITRALVSVSDKTGLAEFCKVLAEYGVEILSTGGTAKLIRSAGIPVKDVSEHTGSPEILDGRVKTLHPRIHGGILYRRELESHVEEVEEQGIAPIDMVVCNLYPFENTVAKEGVSLADAIENIDIGGPCMVRASAKNHKDVTVIVSPSQYEQVAKELRQNEGCVNPQTRFELALAAFRHTAHYDAAISTWLSSVGDEGLPPLKWMELDRSYILADENSDGAVYGGPLGVTGGACDSTFIAGDDPSARDFVSCMLAGKAAKTCSGTAVSLVRKGFVDNFAMKPSVVDSLAAVAAKAKGVQGIYIGFGCEITAEMAQLIASAFENVAGIAAPDFSEEAIEYLEANTRWGKFAPLFVYVPAKEKPSEYFFAVESGLLAQKADCSESCILEVVSSLEPNQDKATDAKVAWKLLSYFKSPAITFVRNGVLESFSSGDPDLSVLAKSAIWKSGANCRGAVAALSENPEDPSDLSLLFSAGIAGVVIPGNVKSEEAMENLANHHKALLFKSGSEKNIF